MKTALQAIAGAFIGQRVPRKDLGTLKQTLSAGILMFVCMTVYTLLVGKFLSVITELDLPTAMPAGLGETLHWALFEDTPVVQLFPKLVVPTVVAAYDSFREPELLRQAVSLIPGGMFDMYHGTPYIARSHPDEVVNMFLKHFA